MSRWFTAGMDAAIYATIWYNTAEGQLSQIYVGGAPTFNTSRKWSTNGYCAPQFTAAGRYARIDLGSTLSSTHDGSWFYWQNYVYVDAASISAEVLIWRLVSATTGNVSISARLQTDGKIRLFDGAGNPLGSGTTMPLGEWVRVQIGWQLSSSGDDEAHLRVNGTVVDEVTTSLTFYNATGQMRIDWGWYSGAAASFSISMDDAILNDDSGSDPFNTWPEHGMIACLRPVADSALGKWEEPQTTGSDTTDIFEAVNNDIPLGLSHSDADSRNGRQIFNASSSVPSSYDAEIESYSEGGIPSFDEIRFVRAIVRVATSSTISTNTGTYELVSNPVVSSVSVNFEQTGGSASTEPTGWTAYMPSGEVTASNPSVVRATRPVLRLTKTTATTRAHLCDWMALYVEHVPIYHFSGTRTFVAVGGLASALGSASSGDVLVLAEGTHDVSTNVPAGVTIRGICGDDTTLNVTSTIELGHAVTIRDLTVTATGVAFDLSAGSTWFEGITFDSCRVTEGAPPPKGATATFHRCTFDGSVSNGITLGLGAVADIGHVTFRSCLFINDTDHGSDAAMIVVSDITDTTGLVLTFANCTIISTVDRPVLNFEGGDGEVVYTNNVASLLNGVHFFGASVGTHSGSGNYCNENPGEDYVTVVPDLHLHAYAPTNKSPFRNAVQASGFDRNHLPLSTSAGCYQWREQGSAIYKPRFLNPVNGIVFSYDGNTFTGSTEALSRVVRQVYDHLEVACRVRQYVQDLTHPSLGRFWVTADGYYRLTVDAGTFDLVISSPASRIFGTANLNDVDDTD